jgi:hypothetical protein
MGVIYSVFTLTQEIREWLASEGIDVPQSTVASRYPTPNEISATLNSMSDISVEYTIPNPGGTWQALMSTKPDPDNGPWTLINISEYKSDSIPQPLWFEKGWDDLIINILKKLSLTTGPLVLYPDTGDVPVVVTLETDINKVHRLWNNDGDDE